MKRINSETVQRILDTAQITDVVSDFVALKRSGSGFKGLCPFHNERTPSFSVSPSKNICKCFSCGKGGSPVNFIMELEQMSFNEALRYLANKYHIEISEEEMTSEEQEAENNRASMFAINDFAGKHFAHNLLETPEGRSIGLSYFRERGINETMIKKFGLGYALEQSTELINAAKNAGYNPKYLVETGLAIKRDNGDMYDRFKGRVIYPVYTVSGKTVAFGGRTLKSDKTVAKYVNSPESLIYTKSRELYGMYQAKHAVSKLNKCILVEGYMDVISMHQRGIENVVASSGTSLTEGQIRLIHRFAENVTLVYDADPAGIKASLRGITMLLAEGLNIRLLLLPPGEDPDSFAQSHTAEEVEKYIEENETDFITFVTNVQLQKSAKDPKARAEVINEVVNSISAIPDNVVRNEYIQQCSQLLGIDDAVLNAQVAKFMARRYEKEAQDRIREKNRKEAGITNESGDTNPNDGAGEAQIDADILTLGRSTVATSTGSLPVNIIRHLQSAELQAITYIIRYGMLQFGYMQGADGEAVALTVLQAINLELTSNDFAFTNPGFQKVFELCLELSEQIYASERERASQEIKEAADRLRAEETAALSPEGDMSSIVAKEKALEQRIADFEDKALQEFDKMFFPRHLCSHPDNEVRTIVNDLAIDKYKLSKMHTRYSHVASEEERISDLVSQAIFSWRDALLQKAIYEVKQELTQLATSSQEKMQEALVTLAELQNNRTLLAKHLGDRVVTGRI